MTPGAQLGRRRTIVWFRKDLRVDDHAPLLDAADEGEVIPLFVLDPRYFGADGQTRAPHRIQFLLDALVSLREALRKRGSDLVVVPGPAASVLPALARRWHVDRVVAHRVTEPGGRRRDEAVRAALACPLRLYEGETLHPPGTLRTRAGAPHAVFTHFARGFARQAMIGPALAAPARLPPLPSVVRAEQARFEIPSMDPSIDRNPQVVRGDLAAAANRLGAFIAGAAWRYEVDRNRMDRPGTSRLSADLKFGTLSPRMVWNAVQDALGPCESARVFHNELVWREFTHSTLWDRPELLGAPFRREFRGFPALRQGQGSARAWQAWAEGRTGYPLVDAAARQLLAEGFVHNRARMISASFLTKHLLLPYAWGEAHYMRYLVDGDAAQNNAGWQWSAGCGCDAQPYFRVFNPVLQGKRFDPDGAYVKRWLPALSGLPASFVHRPWQAPPAVLRDAGVKLGDDYPAPIVDHRFARERFLALAADHIRGSRSGPAPHLQTAGTGG